MNKEEEAIILLFYIEILLQKKNLNTFITNVKIVIQENLDLLGQMITILVLILVPK